MIKTNNIDSNVLSRCNTKDLMKDFKNVNVMLEKVKKSLEDFLDSKKMVFPRL